MVVIGISYLLFEKKLLAKSKVARDSITPANNTLSRSLIGLQVRFSIYLVSPAYILQIGFIALAMLVTRSSVVSLQAKLGLPRGNQIVGWLILGMKLQRLKHLRLLTKYSTTLAHAFPAPYPTQQPLPPSTNGDILDIFANLCPFDNLL